MKTRTLANLLVLLLLSVMLVAASAVATGFTQPLSGGASSSDTTAPTTTALPLIKAAAEAALIKRMGSSPSEGFLEENLQQVGTWAFGTITIPLPPGRDEAPDSHLFLARVDGGQWQAAINGSSNFSQWAAYAPSGLFSDAARSIFVSSAHPSTTGVPLLSFPWAVGDTWTFVQGPHGRHDQNTPPLASLDFAKGISTPYETALVDAAWEGVVSITCNGMEININHSNGWQTHYYHIRDPQVTNGQFVQRHDALGYTSTNVDPICHGVAHGIHVHFSLAYDGVDQEFDGKYVGGYVVKKGDVAGQGCLVRGLTSICAFMGQVYNDGVIGDGSATPIPANTPASTDTPIPPPPNPPILVSPADGAWRAETAPQLCWQSGGGQVSSYKVELTARSSGAIYNLTTVDTCIEPALLNSLYDGYDWRVQAGGSGGWSDWSTSRVFWIGPNPPILDRPGNGVWDEEDAPQLCWHNGGSGQVSNYNIYVWGNGFNLKQLNLEGTCWQPTQLGSHYGSYQWKVQAVGSWGRSDWSEVYSFGIYPHPPTLVSPNDGAQVNDYGPNLCWQNGGGGQIPYYRVQISGARNLTQEVRGTCWRAWQLDHVYGSYTWQVQAYGLGANGWHSDWSAQRTFSIVTRQTNTPTATRTPTTTSTPSNTPTATRTPTTTSTPSNTPTETQTPTTTSTPSNTLTETQTPTTTSTPSNTPTPTLTTTHTPTNTATVTPTDSPTERPTEPIATSTPGPTWRRIVSANYGTGSWISGMAVTAENNAWAVGGYDDANNRRQSIAYYWDGSTWGAFAVPSPGLYGSLSSVASLVANNAWAVGDYYDGSCTCSLSLVTHFDGSTWTQVSVPNPSSIENTLGAVALSPDGTAWAVGEYRDPGCNCYQSLVLHFDGSSWVVVNVATPGISSSLYSISTTDANNAWAVGWYFDGSHSHTLTLHWDGSSWQTVPSPDLGINDHLNGVYNSSDGTAWAVGQYMDAQGTERAMTMHWDGSAWSTVVAPSPFYGSHLTSVVSNSPTDAWSAGVYAGADGNYRPMLYHWDGSSWTDLGSPYSGNGTSDCLLSSIVRLNSSYIWAGGSCNGETMTFRYSSQ